MAACVGAPYVSYVKHAIMVDGMPSAEQDVQNSILVLIYDTQHPEQELRTPFFFTTVFNLWRRFFSLLFCVPPSGSDALRFTLPLLSVFFFSVFIYIASVTVWRYVQYSGLEHATQQYAQHNKRNTVYIILPLNRYLYGLASEA